MALAAVIFASCGEVTSPPSVGAGGRAGSTSTGAGASGSSGSGGMGNGGTRANDAADAAPEAGMGNGGSEFMYPAGCPQPNAIPAPDAEPEQVIVIQSVNFRTSEIVIRNVSSSPVLITGGEMGWQWCNIPQYNLIIQADLSLEPDQTYAFRPINQNEILRLYPGESERDPNELAIQITTGSFMTPSLYRAFVSWGAGHTGGRESVAVTAFLWTNQDRVEIEPGHAGFIITGRADEGSGYTSVPERCLVAPPNPPGAVVPVPAG